MHIQCHNPNGILMLNAYSPDWRRQESQKTRFSGNDLHYLLYYPGPPSQFPFASAPPTPYEVVADIVVHVLHLKLFKRLPEHAKLRCRFSSKLAHFKPNNLES